MRFILCLFVFMASFCIGYAIEFSPMSATFDGSGDNATQSFQVYNPSSTDKAAVRLFIGDRSIDVDGNDTFVENEEDFIIYPPQMILQPEQTQIVRVTWMGNEESSVERAYRIIAEQLPVDLKKRESDGKASIRLLMRFVGSIYVVPNDASADIVLESSYEDSSDDMVLLFENRGTAHALLRELSLSITPHDTDVEALHFSSEELAGISGENILAGSKRKFFLSLPDDFAKNAFDIKFSYEKD
ncbi:MAG: molecular chaperone [Waddliaceae bacterium]|nr:molecular chaperone [Waddliaceae bacterium]